MASRRLGRTSKVRIKVNRQSGEPAVKMLKRAPWPVIRKPMRAIASVRTLRKVDPAKGVTQPEGRNLLQRAGVGVRQRAPGSILVKSKTAPSNRNQTVIRPPSPTNRGGVRNPYKK